jgi:hypothetical protein
MKPEDIQHGGNHYKGQPKHLQPIYLGTALKLNPMEYSVLKYLLRHRKKGGLLDLQKMMHFGQMLLQEEYGVETEIKYLGEPIDAEFEVVPESQPVTSDNPQESPACPFKVGDILQHKEHGRKCRVEQINGDNRIIWVRDLKGSQAFYIAKTGWRYYEPVSDDSPQPQECPFKVGDVIHHRDDVRGRSEIKWRVTGFTANSVQVVSDDVYRSPSHIERQVWHRYAKVEQPADKPTELPACSFKAGDIIRGIGEPNTSKWKVERVRSDRIDVITYDAQKYPGVIEYGCWQNYIRVNPIDGTPVDSPPQPCPFVVGDTIRSIKFPQYVFHVTEINSDDIVAYNREACSNHVIPRAQWNGYEIKTLITIDKPAATC